MGAGKETGKRAAQTQARRKTLSRETVSLIRRIGRWAIAFILTAVLSGAVLAYEVQPLGIAFLCAAGAELIPFATAGAGMLVSVLGGAYGERGGLYLGAFLLAVGIRYAAGRFLCSVSDTPSTHKRSGGFGIAKGHGKRYLYAEDADVWEGEDEMKVGEADISPGHGFTSGGTVSGENFPAWAATLMRIRTFLFPDGVFAQTTGVCVGISVLAACPVAVGFLLGTAETVRGICAAGFVLCSVPIFTWLFCGLGRRGTFPAHREGAVGALCYALTASAGGGMLLGFSVKLLLAQAITLYISKKNGYLRGGLCGLLCGFACDALYAPAYALIGAVSGLLFSIHAAPAVILSCLAGAAYAVYVGEFAAIRSVIPEMVAVSAAAYPLIRYLPETLQKTGALGWLKENGFLSRPGNGNCTGGAGTEAQSSEDAVMQSDSITPEQLGIPGLAEQLDALSGILSGLSATFDHLSERQKKPGLYEIRQMCESTADRYCLSCEKHDLCWEEEFSSTADAMGRITLCIHRKGRADAAAAEAFAPLDRRCPSLPKMLSAMNDAAASLCEEKITKDKTGVAAEDYDGMAKLLRASAEEAARAGIRDPALSGRLGRAMHRMGFHARDVSVYGARRRTVIARGVDLGQGMRDGGLIAGGMGGENGVTYENGELLLGTEELREAFSALSGVKYRSPEYSVSAGGREIVMTMHACPKVAVKSGCWGEKKAGEEITGDVMTLFANRADYFYALLCDGMGSGREASVTAQISALFLEKLLSVSCAGGAALNLLNSYLRSRAGECSATVDLCEIDMITGEARFLKCGAAATYLLRGDSMFRIASQTMPLGILREVTAEETSFPLCSGDTLLFFSDGVCGECEDASWISAALARAKEDYARAYALGKRRCSARREAACAAVQKEDAIPDPAQTENVQAEAAGAESQPGAEAQKLLAPLDFYAKALGETAKARIGRQDDMTVIVMEVEVEE